MAEDAEDPCTPRSSGGSLLSGHDRKCGSHEGHFEVIHSSTMNLYYSQLTVHEISIMWSEAVIVYETKPILP